MHIKCEYNFIRKLVFNIDSMLNMKIPFNIYFLNCVEGDNKCEQKKTETFIFKSKPFQFLSPEVSLPCKN